MKKITILALIAVILSGCATVEKKLEASKTVKQDGSVIRIKKDGKGNRWMELTGYFITPAVFSGTFTQDASDDIDFEINKFYFLSSWENGWTEGTYEASGKITLKKEGTIWTSTVVQKPEIGEIVTGAIRYYDDYFTGEKGTSQVKNRFERIRAINAFLKKNGFPDCYYHAWKNTLPETIETGRFETGVLAKIKDGKDRDFVKSLYAYNGINCTLKRDVTLSARSRAEYVVFTKNGIADAYKAPVMNYLFPELVAGSVLYSKDVSSDLKPKSASDYSIGESMVWNKKYTQKLFPEDSQQNMRELRNNGTFYRDFEESLWLFYMEYNLDYYFDRVLPGSKFDTIK